MAESITIAQSDKNLISDLAEKVVNRGMAVPAIFFLDMMKYLSFFGGQLMVFLDRLLPHSFHPNLIINLQSC